ncbi:MAG: hypothetical protein KJ070_19280, partial [Verrucomicrobia bacterium]|nr:hypothetical protein [Verrucomicrobiota bacterium]
MHGLPAALGVVAQQGLELALTRPVALVGLGVVFFGLLEGGGHGGQLALELIEPITPLRLDWLDSLEGLQPRAELLGALITLL